MKNKTLPRSLRISIAVIICLTVFVFSFLGISIHNMSENTIGEIGTSYMAGMNEQVFCVPPCIRPMAGSR